MKPDEKTATLPWWRYGMVWLVISGPLIVVMASIASAVIAARGADPVVTQTADQDQERPAIQARNHAATAGLAPAKR